MLRIEDILRVEKFRESMRKIPPEREDCETGDERPPRAPCPGGARERTGHDRDRGFDDLEDSAW
jgi:hypothetical protein